MTFNNYPPGPMSGPGGPNDDGCPCATCPALVPGGICDCDLEVVDDEIPIFRDPLCDVCGACREHCHCYDGDAAAEIEEGDLLDALNPDRESGVEWDTGDDHVPLTSTFVLFHRRELAPLSYYTCPPTQVSRADYQRVAQVQAPTREAVYTLSQHLGELPWWAHPGVTLDPASRKIRSTSVGDVIVDAEGTVWMVQVVDFGPVTWTDD